MMEHEQLYPQEPQCHGIAVSSGVVHFPPILGYTGAQTTGLQGSDFGGKTSRSRGAKPLWTRLVVAEAVPGPAVSANADGFGRSSLRADFCLDVLRIGCA